MTYIWITKTELAKIIKVHKDKGKSRTEQEEQHYDVFHGNLFKNNSSKLRLIDSARPGYQIDSKNNFQLGQKIMQTNWFVSDSNLTLVTNVGSIIS